MPSLMRLITEKSFPSHPKGDPISRSYRVRISLDADTPFMTGMTAEANIIIRKDENAILLPSSTVKSGKIWTLADGKIQVKKVKSGAQAKGTVEILEGIDKVMIWFWNLPTSF
jgi:multidrug efflux system membrane fusion protein